MEDVKTVTGAKGPWKVSIEMTLQEIRAIINQVALNKNKVDHFNVVYDRRLGGANLIEINEENNQLLLYIESLYHESIGRLLERISKSLEKTDYIMEKGCIDYKDCRKRKYCCKAIIKERK